MLSLPRHILLLVLWMTFFFNIERLHVNHSELVNIALPVYVLVAVLLVVGVILPQWRRMSTGSMLALGFFAFGATLLLSGRPFWGDAYTYVTLFELMSVLITITLAHRVGQLTADFSATVRALLFSDLDGRVHTPGEAEEIVNREMRSARRRKFPLSLVLVEADASDSKAELNATAQEIHRLLTRRVGMVRLTRLFASSLRPSDAIVHEINRGRWLLLTSGVSQNEAPAVLQRLDETTRQLGIRLKYGIASFPDEGLTFQDLLGRAEHDLHHDAAEQSSEILADPTPLQSQEPGVQYHPLKPSSDGDILSQIGKQ